MSSDYWDVSIRRIISIVGVCFLFIRLTAAAAEPAQIHTTCQMEFASIAQGQALLASDDAFLQALTPLDRSLRLRRIRPVSRQAFVKFATAQVRPWTASERARLKTAWERVLARLQALEIDIAPHCPARVVFIKSSGREEYDAEYTRQNAMIFSQSFLNRRGDQPDVLFETVAHELFHILSRHSKDFRDKAYAVLGFRPLQSAPPMGMLQKRLLTNPDSPLESYAAMIDTEEGVLQVMPVLLSPYESFRPGIKNYPDAYWDAKLLVSGSDLSVAPNKPATPQLLPIDHAGYRACVGENSDVIFHPEEVLADNFPIVLAKGASIALLREVHTPELIDDFRHVLRGFAAPAVCRYARTEGGFSH